MNGLNVNYSTGESSVHFEMSGMPFDRMRQQMATTAGKVMAQAIKDVLREEITPTQSQIRGDAGPQLRGIASLVADSLMVEVGSNTGGEAEVRFGSDPMDTGGVVGKRDGKLAAILEYGMRQFAYGFTFKTIENTSSWSSVGGGGGFINAKGNGGQNATHKGFEPLDWLSKARDRATPKIGPRIAEALKEAYS